MMLSRADAAALEQLRYDIQVSDETDDAEAADLTMDVWEDAWRDLGRDDIVALWRLDDPAIRTRKRVAKLTAAEEKQLIEMAAAWKVGVVERTGESDVWLADAAIAAYYRLRNLKLPRIFWEPTPLDVARKARMISDAGLDTYWDQPPFWGNEHYRATSSAVRNFVEKVVRGAVSLHIAFDADVAGDRLDFNLNPGFERGQLSQVALRHVLMHRVLRIESNSGVQFLANEAMARVTPFWIAMNSTAIVSAHPTVVTNPTGNAERWWEPPPDGVRPSAFWAWLDDRGVGHQWP